MDAALDLLISSHLGIIYKCLAFCSIERSRPERLWLFLENHYSKQFSKNETLSVPLFNNTFYKLILYGRTHNKSQKRRCSEYCLETETEFFILQRNQQTRTYARKNSGNLFVAVRLTAPQFSATIQTISILSKIAATMLSLILT